MPTIHCETSLPSLLTIVAASAAFAAGFWFYRHTVPVVPRPLRFLLALLRGTALALTVVLVARPILRLTTTSTERPVIAVLLDNSESMQIVDNGERRGDQARRLLRDPRLTSISDRADLRFFTFGITFQAVTDPADTLRGGEEGTDFAVALQGLAREREEQRIDAALFLTDGILTRGRNPLSATAVGIPLHAIVLGDTSDPRDLSIIRVDANRLVYEGLSTPVDVTLRTSGVRAGERTHIVLRDSAREVARAYVELGPSAGEQKIALTYRPEGEGVRRYTIVVDPLPGEQTGANNRSSFAARVLPGKTRVLIIAGSPSPDVAVVGQTLREEKGVLVSNLTERSNGSFVERGDVGGEVDSADVVVLLGYPGRATGGGSWRQIAEAIRTRSLPLLVALGRGTDFVKIAELSPRIPFRFEPYGGTEQYVTPLPVERERLHPLLAGGTGDAIAAWRRLPPLIRVAGAAHTVPGARTLVLAGGAGLGANDPLVAVRTVAGGRSIGVAGYGLWRWRLMVQGDEAARDLLGGFLSASMKWLTTPDDAKPVRVRPLRDVFPPGAPIGFSGEVYDAAGRPVEGGRVVVTLHGQREEIVTEFRSLGNGRYEGEFEGLPEGEYRFTALAELNGVLLGRAGGRVLIGGVNEEMRETRSDVGLLRALAARTGGEVVTPDDVARLASVLASGSALAPHRVERTLEFRLQAWPGMLVLILVLLALEWVLRRRAGML